jgi:glycosyltransferase involved in cell wall biosynthesis
VETHRLGDGTEVRALDAEAHLFVFLAGLVKDRFARLLTYSDVRRVAATDDLDWDCVERLAALDSLDQPLLRSLHTVAATLGLASLGPWPALRAPSLPWAVLCRRGTRLAGSRPRPRRLLLMPLVIPGRRVEVARSLVRRVRPPREIAQDLYPDGASSPVARLRKDRVTAAAPAPAPATTRPTVAVVIPTFQRRDLVVEAVRSVLDQQVPADEVIVVDDGSTDGTADALHAAFGTAVRVIQQPNGGPSAARNEGIRHARSDIVAFQDSDNRWQPHHLALVHELLARHPAAVLVATSDGYEFGDETAADARRRDLAEALLLEAVDLAFLSTVACPRSIVTEVGGFDEDLRFGEDVDLFIRLALHGPFVTARASTLERETTAESLEASGWAQGRYAHYLTRSAANALVEIGRPSAVVTDGALRAAMARRAIAAILTRLEAGADATELHPCIEEAIRWQPGFATGPWWIVRQVEAAHRGRDADDLRSEMLTTVAAAWPSARANP